MSANKILSASLGFALALVTVPATAFAAPPKEADAADAATDADPQPEPEPTQAEPPEPATEGPSASTLWENLDGGNVTLQLDDQSTVAGEVKGVAGPDLLVARTGDRRIVAVPTTRVSSIRAKFEPKRDRTIRIINRPANNHTGLLAGGGVLVGLGATFVLAGVATGAFIPFLVYFVTLPVAGTGAAMIGAGVPMIIEGKRRRDAAVFNTSGAEPQTLPGVTVLSF